MVLLSSLSLFAATEEQTIESRRRTHAEFGNGMTMEEYLERDAINDQHEIARDGNLTTWVLAPRDAHDTLDFMCSCETFRRSSLAIRKSPEPESVIGYGIASVFTPPSNRGLGYAKHMSRLLHWVLAPDSALPKEFPVEWGTPPPRVEGAGNALFSALWSDVGGNFYQQCGFVPGEEGWVVSDSRSTTWNVKEFEQNKQRQENIKRETNWVYLDSRTVQESWKKDAERIHEEMAQLAPTFLETRRFAFAFLPHNGVAEFHFRRWELFWGVMKPRPVHWGIIAGAASINVSDFSMNDDTSFATWGLELRPPGPKILIVTRLRVQADNFENLLNEVMAQAIHLGMEKVEIWNLPTEMQEISIKLGGITTVREEHLPAFKWYGLENPSEVTWLYNEKYCWC